MAQKKMKDIFTNEMGQILFPGQPTVIQTKKISPGTDITMKNTKPQIALTPYGAAQMAPNQNYSFAGNTVVELPMAQMGTQAGGDDQQAQIMQIIQMYAQLKGVDPNQLIQELQALPQEEQQKSFELMIGEVQSAMAQQQQAAQQPQQDQSMGMPMARNGGLTMHQLKGVVDSMVKDAVQRYMSGGEAFPQANKYPEQWAGYNGTQYQGLDKSQVQQAVRDNTSTVPKGYTLANTPQEFLAPQLGGSDYNNVVQDMLISGLVDRGWGFGNEDVKRAQELYATVYGKELDPVTMRAIIRRKEKATGVPLNWATGIPINADYSKYLDYIFNPPKPTLTGEAEGGEPCIDCFDKYNPSPQAQTYLPYNRKGETRPNFMFMNGGSKDEFGGQPDLDSIYRMMRSGGLAVNAKKKRGESLNPKEFQEYLSGGSLKEFQGVTQSTTGNTMTGGISPYSWQSSTPTQNDQAVAIAKQVAQQKQAEVPTYQEDPNLKKTTVTTEPNQGLESSTQSQGKKQYKSYPGLHPANYLTALNTAMGDKGSVLGLIGNVASLVGDFATPPMAGNRYGVTASNTKQDDANDLTGKERRTFRRELRMLNKPTRPQASDQTADSQPSTDQSVTANQSVTDSNIDDFISAGNKRLDRALDLKDKGINIYSGDETAKTFGPTIGALDTAIWKGPGTLISNEEKAEEESIAKSYDILNNSDKYSPEEIAKANEIINARINDWSSENASEFNISGGPQLTTGPRAYGKGGNKKVLPKAQFALPPSNTNTVGGFTAPNANGYTATIPATGPSNQPSDLVQDSPPPAEGILSGTDTQGNAVSINPNMASDYADGSKPQGPTIMSNRDVRRQARQERKDFKKTDEYKDARKQQRKDFWSDPNANFDHAKAARMVGATQGIADFFRVKNQEYMEDELKKMGTNTSATLGVSQNRDRGDFMANTGRFRPDDYTEAQDAGRSMTDQTSFYNTFNQMYNAKMGGRILDFLEDGGVYDLDEDTIRLIMEAGGSVEYI